MEEPLERRGAWVQIVAVVAVLLLRAEVALVGVEVQGSEEQPVEVGLSSLYHEALRAIEGWCPCLPAEPFAFVAGGSCLV